MVEHAGADDLIECSVQLLDLMDRELIDIEVLQAIFALQLARVTQAGFAYINCRDSRTGLAQCIEGSLGSSTPADENLSVCSRLARWPK